MRLIKVEKATPERLQELKIDSWSPWECGRETFDWEYSSDETAYVKAGQVRVRTEEGQEVEFGTATSSSSPAGSSAPGR